MDLGLTQEQEMVRASARDFLARECPPTHVRAMENDPAGYSRDLWRQMADLGWQGLALPEQHGGTGATFLDLCVLIEEHGRFLFPGPFIPTALAALAVLNAGTEKQKQEWLPAVASGERTIAYAQTEPAGTWDAGGVTLQARRDGDAYVLTGAKLFVPYGAACDALLTVARTAGAGAEGISLFLVDTLSRGLTATPLRTIGADHQAHIEFRDVHVPAAHLLGPPDSGWPLVERVLAWGAAMKCAEMVGIAQRVLEMSVDYAKTRVQFERPIGSFQVIQHYCANMATDVDGARYLAYEAIWRLSEGLESARDVAMAKAWVGDACRRVCALGHQVHGAIGFTAEHDLQLYFRRAKMAELAFGDGDHHRELVAAHLGGSLLA